MYVIPSTCYLSVFLPRARIEMKVKEVEDMKQEMEALQAMVVAQTAQLILKKEQLVCSLLCLCPSLY